MILLFWKGPNRILQSMDLNSLETMERKYGTCYQTTVNQWYHWVILKNIIKSRNGPSCKCPVESVLLLSNCYTCSVSNVILVYLTICIRLFYVCLPFYSLHASMGNVYKLSTLVFTSSFYVIHIWTANCATIYMYYFHVNVTLFTHVG